MPSPRSIRAADCLAASAGSRSRRAVRPIFTIIGQDRPYSSSTTINAGASGHPGTDHMLELKDDRTLSYALYGPSDGYPVMFLHGMPSCRLEAAGLASSNLLTDANVRLIAPERPGFGQSTADRKRTITGYAEDLGSLARELGLQSQAGGYSIVGGSGGGPYALACAHPASSTARLGGLHRIGVFAGAPPYVPPIPYTNTSRDRHLADRGALHRDWMWTSKLMFGLATRLPTLAHALGLMGMNGTAWLYNTTYGRKMLEGYVRAFLSREAAGTLATETSTIEAKPDNHHEPIPEGDSSAVMDREVAALIRLCQESWHQGPLPWLDEVRLLGRPWGFDPTDIRLPVKIWHGSKDANAPLSAMQWLADRIPGAKLEVLDQKSHFQLGGSLGDMLRWASGRDKS